MRVTQAMVDRKPAAKYQCPSCGAYRFAATMVWCGEIERYTCRVCAPEGAPTLADVQLWKGPIR